MEDRIEEIIIGKHKFVVNIPEESQLDTVNMNYILQGDVREINIECNFSLEDNFSGPLKKLDRSMRSLNVCFGI